MTTGTTKSTSDGVSLSQILELAGDGAHLDQVSGKAEADVRIAEITLDSARVVTGGMFAALPGTRTHGARFARQGQALEAAAILTDEQGLEILREAEDTRPVVVVSDIREVLGTISSAIYGQPSDTMTMIGITGTSGKTTCSYLLERGLMAAGKKVGLIGTTGTRINGEPVPTSLTTPEAPTLHKLFSQMAAQGVTHVVMEVSSHALSLGRVQGTHFDVAGFTNLSQDHLDFHPTMEEYFAAKAKLFVPGSSQAAKHAVVVIDDQWGKKLLNLVQGDKPVTTVSTRGEQADFMADAPIACAATGTQQVTVHTPEKNTCELNIGMPGQFNIANATLALAIVSQLDVDTEKFIHGLAQAQVPGRMQRIDAGQGFIAVVDYAHKPAAVAEVLDALRGQVSAHDAARVGIVLGAGGNRDHSKRPIMGAEAARRADLVIITDDNPRDEEPAPIRVQVRQGAEAAANETPRHPVIREIGDRAEAIRALVAWARPGDAVVVAGKGHEQGQLIAGVMHPFDDAEQLRQAIEEARAGKSART